MFDNVWVLTNANGLGGASQWLPSADGIPPAPRVFHSLTFDSNSNRLLAFGGALPGAIDYVGSNKTHMTHANGLGGAAEWRVNLDAGSSLPLARAAWAGYFGATNRMVVSSGSSGLPDPGLLDASGPFQRLRQLHRRPALHLQGHRDRPGCRQCVNLCARRRAAGHAPDRPSVRGHGAWIPAIAQIGNHTVTVRATDRAGLFATQTLPQRPSRRWRSPTSSGWHRSGRSRSSPRQIHPRRYDDQPGWSDRAKLR